MERLGSCGEEPPGAATRGLLRYGRRVKEWFGWHGMDRRYGACNGTFRYGSYGTFCQGKYRSGTDRQSWLVTFGNGLVVIGSLWQARRVPVRIGVLRQVVEWSGRRGNAGQGAVWLCLARYEYLLRKKEWLNGIRTLPL